MLFNRGRFWSRFQYRIFITLALLTIQVSNLSAELEGEFGLDEFFEDNGIGEMYLHHQLREKKSHHFHSHWYNIKVSEEKEFVWFRVFKNASGTIWEALSPEVPDLKGKKPTKYPSEYKDYFKFAFVRNPWDRIVSCYFHKIVTEKSGEFSACFGKSFEFFVDYISKIDIANANPHIKLQVRLIPPVHQCDFIGKIDNFEEDFKFVCDAIGIEMRDLGNKHETEHFHYSKYYNKRTRKIIADLYEEDIKTFGFEFEQK